MRPLLIALALLGSLPAPAGERLPEPPEVRSVSPAVQVRTRTVEIVPQEAPHRVSMPCEQGEHLLSGGYQRADGDPLTLVIGSYPDGGQWTVVVVNRGKTAQAITISATCLADAAGDSTVVKAGKTHTGEWILQADCPNGTLATGGGYTSAWEPRLGLVEISGNEPATNGGWTVSGVVQQSNPDVRPRAAIEVYAVCRAGLTNAGVPGTTMNVEAGTAVCTPADSIFLPTCVTPRSGSTRVTCESDQLLTGGGYRVTTGDLPGAQSVVTSVAQRDGWTVAVAGNTPANSEIVLLVTPVCVNVILGPPDVSTTPTSGSDVPWIAIVVGALVLLVVFSIIGLIASARSKRPAKQPPAAASIEVVLRAHRSHYRVESFREIP